MKDAELRAAFGALPDSELIRGLILAEVAAIRAGAERELRTMRNLWYDYIKPILSRAGRLSDKTRNGKDVQWDDLLSKYLTELIRDGATTYAELRIVDGSRQRRPAEPVALTMASVDIVGAHYPEVILFTEKDTIWGVVETLASLYGVSAISGGGQPSFACTENTVETILASPTYHGQPLTLLSLTDYDPAGYSIAEAQFAQLADVAGDRCNVTHTRLGLVPDQLTAEERAAKAYTPKDKGFAEWYAQTGGVDGRPLGLELDALALTELQALFAAGIEKRVDLARRFADLRAAFVDLLAWELLAPRVERTRQAMLDSVKANGLWRQVQEAPLPPDLFTAAALAGWGRVNPVETQYGGQPLFDNAGELRAVMAATLADLWGG
jgi:hypothetical protein